MREYVVKYSIIAEMPKKRYAALRLFAYKKAHRQMLLRGQGFYNYSPPVKNGHNKKRRTTEGRELINGEIGEKQNRYRR